jgi:hexosaminidase
VRTEANAEVMTWPRAAALAEVGWSPPAQLDWDGFRTRLAAEFNRYRVLGIHYSGDVFAPPRVPGVFGRHFSQDLTSCSNKVLLNLEDDAPLAGPRAVFLIDIVDPCWLMPGVGLTRPLRLTVAVGQVPFNFQIGSDREKIHLATPRTEAGELEVHLDGCNGAAALVLPLAPAAGNDAVTVLPSAVLPGTGGTHTLCLRFAQHGLDPLWAIDWVELAP